MRAPRRRIWLRTVIRRAADLEGRSVSDGVVTAAQDAARRTIEATPLIQLSTAEQIAFIDALLHPAPLAPAMRRALQAHARLISPPA